MGKKNDWRGELDLYIKDCHHLTIEVDSDLREEAISGGESDQ